MFKKQKVFYFLCGLPRAGNTLLGALLNQNKKIQVTALSPVIDVLYNLEYLKTKDSKAKNFPDQNSLNNLLKNVFNTYYSDWKCDYIIDRNCWGTPDNLEIIKKYCTSKPKIIVLVRDLNEILGSFIYWSLNNPGNFLDEYKTVEEKCDYLMDEQGQIVKFLYAVANLQKQENRETSLFVNYKNLIEDPGQTIERIYSFLNIPFYQHCFDNIECFKANSMAYNDLCFGENLHKVKKHIEKPAYSYEDLIPSYVLDKYQKYNASYLKQ